MHGRMSGGRAAEEGDRESLAASIPSVELDVGLDARTLRS